MKTWIAALLLSISSPAFAATFPLPAAGSFAFTGDFRVAQKLHREVAYAMNPEGEARLASLRAEGYTCEHKERMIYLCSIFQATDGAEELVRSRVVRALGNLRAVFGQRKGEPRLLSKGDAVEEWLVEQPLRFNGRDYPNYRVVLTGGLVKIFLGTPADDGFLVREDGELEYVLDISTTDSPTSYSIYLTIADFRRM